MIACVLSAADEVTALSARETEPRIEARDGNIYVRVDGSDAEQLTTAGRDSAPVLSPDGRWVVFVRSVPRRTISTGASNADAEELWQVSAGGKEPTRLVTPKKHTTYKISWPTSRMWSFLRWPSGFFVTEAYATSGAVHVDDTTNSREHFLLPGSTVEVVRHGEYRDCLLVSQHRYFIGAGSYDWI